MKKSILFSSALMFCQANACERNIISKANRIAGGAILKLLNGGISTEKADSFKSEIQRSIDKLTANLSYDRDGSIGDQIAVQSDLLSLADLLLGFNKDPDLQKAQKLRDIAMSCSMAEVELIKSVMDKMDDPYKFSPPIDNNTTAGDTFDFFEEMQGRLTKKKEDLHK